VLGVAGCAYKSVKPGLFFPKSAIGDESMAGWSVEYVLIDKGLNSRQTLRRSSNFRQAKWVRREVVEREVLFFGIERTVPAGEKPKYKKLTRSTYRHKGSIAVLEANTARQIEHILGKPVTDFVVTDIGHDYDFYIGRSGKNQYSELNGTRIIVRWFRGLG
jgi:hypothetical protein